MRMSRALSSCWRRTANSYSKGKTDNETKEDLCVESAAAQAEPRRVVCLGGSGCSLAAAGDPATLNTILTAVLCIGAVVYLASVYLKYGRDYYRAGETEVRLHRDGKETVIPISQVEFASYDGQRPWRRAAPKG